MGSQNAKENMAMAMACQPWGNSHGGHKKLRKTWVFRGTEYCPLPSKSYETEAFLVCELPGYCFSSPFLHTPRHRLGYDSPGWRGLPVSVRPVHSMKK